ncbi:MAG: hypothetical protein IPQ07_25340 [Myxococcales bacterium]|nr:hypothetical protein [Myxococcales bacterium]
MKKEQAKKLTLTKTTLRQLQDTLTDEQLKAVAGGGLNTHPPGGSGGGSRNEPGC